jgi:pimeloyl-ACP methyl ester carboxylesterase
VGTHDAQTLAHPHRNLHGGGDSAPVGVGRQRGREVGAHSTTENAADVADLRVALGIREWNVFGDSYGTNLAMTYMREYPQGIRSVTLDSVEPPEVVAANLFAPNAGEGFDSLFQACAEQPQCGPGIERTFTNLVRQLEAHPVTTRVEPSAGATR